MKPLREALALAGIAFQLWVVGSSWQNLPARVPTHYGFSGQADAYGGKSSLLLLPAVTIGLYLLLTVLSRFPQAFNYPLEVTAENRPRLEAIALGMIGWLKAELTWTFAYIEWTTIRQAQGLASGLGWGFLPVSLGVVLATVGIGLVWMFRQ